VPGFMLAELVGAALAVVLNRALTTKRPPS